MAGQANVPIVITADDSQARPVYERATTTMERVERAAQRAGDVITNTFDRANRIIIGVVTTLGSLIILKNTIEATFSALKRGVTSLNEQNVLLERSLALWRAARFIINPTIFAAVATGIGFAVHEVGELTLKYADNTRTQAVLAAQSGQTLRSIQDLGNASRIAGKDFQELFDLSEAVQFNATAQQTFKDLGIRVTEAGNRIRPIPALLADTARALEAMEDPEKRARTAFVLFGSSGEDALKLLDERFARSIDRLVEFEIAMDRNAIRNIERFRRDVSGLRGTFDSVIDGARALGTSIEQDAVTKFAAIYTTIKDALRAWEIFSGAVTGGIARMFPENRGQQQVVGTFSGGLGNLMSAIRGAITSAYDPVVPGQVAGRPGRPDVPRLEALQTPLTQFVDNVIKQMDQQKDALEGRRDALKNRIDQIRDILRSDRELQERGLTPTISSSDRTALQAEFLTRQQQHAALQTIIDALEEQAAQEKKVGEATTQVDRIVSESQAKELRGWDLINFRRQEALKQLGLTPELIGRINKAYDTLIRLEREDAELKRAQAVLKFGTEARRVTNDVFVEEANREREFVNQTTEMRNRAELEVIDTRERLLRNAHDAELAELGTINTQIVEGKLAVEQRKLEIEERFALQRFALHAARLQRETELEIQEMERRAIIEGASLDAIAERRDQILLRSAERGKQLTAETEGTIQTARNRAAQQSAEIITSNNQRIFDGFKRQAEGVFDALLTKASSVWSAIGNAFKITILTAVKDVVSSNVAGFLTRLVGGTPPAGGQQYGSILGSILFGGARAAGATYSASAVSGGGYPFPTVGGIPLNVLLGPGGTAGFSGAPVQVSGTGTIGGLGQLAGLAGIGGRLGVPGLGGIGPLALGGAALGLSGAFALGRSSNPITRALAIPAGIGSGLFGFGALASLFPSLIAAGPVGWIIAGGIGATIGIIGLLTTRAEDKIVQKVREAYNITISREFAKNVLLPMIKQQFGGDIGAGILAQPIRDLIELYAMSTGQGISSIGGSQYRQPRGLSVIQSGGQLTALPTYAGGTVLPPPSIASGGVTVVQVTMPAEAVNDAFNGRTQNFLIENPRVSAASMVRSARQNSGRNEFIRAALAPGLVTG